MRTGRGKKVQITLPLDVIEKIEGDLKKTYLPRSDWFLKIVEEYFERTAKHPTTKPVIKLDI